MNIPLDSSVNIFLNKSQMYSELGKMISSVGMIKKHISLLKNKLMSNQLTQHDIKSIKPSIIKFIDFCKLYTNYDTALIDIDNCIRHLQNNYREIESVCNLVEESAGTILRTKLKDKTSDVTQLANQSFTNIFLICEYLDIQLFMHE